MDREQAREAIYGMPFAEWKARYQPEATADQLAAFEAARKRAGDENDQSGAPKLAEMEAAKARSSPSFRAQFTQDAQYCMDALLELERTRGLAAGGRSPKGSPVAGGR